MSAFVRIARGVFSSLRASGVRIGERISNFVRNLPFIRNRFNVAPEAPIYVVNPHWSPFSNAGLLVAMTILSIASNGSVSFKGTLPFPRYENASFECKMPPFKETKFLKKSDQGQLFIDDKLIAEGSCQFRQVKLPYLFMDMWDGVISLGNYEKTKFFMYENAIDRQVESEFSEIVTSRIEEMQTDIGGFLKFDVDLGSSKDFEIDTDAAPDSISVKFTIESVGSFDLKMTAVELFGEGYPLIGTFQSETDEASFFFNLRRLEVPFYIVSNGIVEFKKPNNEGLTAILFATDGKEMRFQATKQLTNEVWEEQPKQQPSKTNVANTSGNGFPFYLFLLSILLSML